MLNQTEEFSLEIIGDIGATNASTFLSQMMCKSFRVSIPWTASCLFEKLPKILGEQDEKTVCVSLGMNGDLHGVILFLFKEKSAIAISAMLQNQKQAKKLTDMDISALKESGNILANAYLNAIAEKLNLKITDTVPNVAVDMLGSVVEGFLSEYSQKTDEIILIKNDYYIEKKDIKATALILFDPKHYTKLKTRLRKCTIKLT